jgi:hypothetical protein
MVRALLGRVAVLELAAPVLAQALEPFPMPVRGPQSVHIGDSGLVVLEAGEFFRMSRTAAAPADGTSRTCHPR